MVAQEVLIVNAIQVLDWIIRRILPMMLRRSWHILLDLHQVYQFLSEHIPLMIKNSLAVIKYLLTRATGLEMLRSIIDHRKIFVTAMNGPAVGGGAAWFTGSSDILLVSTSTYLQVNFSSLGLVPEYGSAINFAQSMGVHRANEVLMFGRKLTAAELQEYGIANRIFEAEGFQESVKGYLQEQLKMNDGKSMMEVKRLQNAPLRDGRLVAVVNAMDALAERFVEGAPMERFAIKKKLLEGRFSLRFGGFTMLMKCVTQLIPRNGLRRYRGRKFNGIFF